MKTLICTATLVAALTATAYGQGYSAPPPPPPGYTEAPAATMTRQGVTVGVGFGLGQMSDGEEQETAAALSLRLGFAVTPRILIVGDISSAAAESDGVDFMHTLVGAEVVGFVHDRAYLTGGLGIQKITAKVGDDELETDGELGLVLGGGYEVVQSGNFALSAEFRAYGADFNGTTMTSATIGAAATWF